MDNELILFDRLEIIKTTNQKYDLENNAYLSFSGGKDSTILHHLLDMALPNNKIPRVFIDTGIEYQMIRDFVLELAKNDERFVIIKPSIPIKPMLEKYGYPFKSKEHSLRVHDFNNGSQAKYIKKYIENSGKSKFACPPKLLYQFEERGKYNYSRECCYKLKKEPAHKWAKNNHRPITITGMRKEEGGNRKTIQGCALTDKSGKLKKFHPLLVVDDNWEEWFIDYCNKRTHTIALAPLYCQPYNFKRTGCKGCPYNINLQEDLETMELYMPNERKQCELIWKPVYEEYRRLNYRLKKVEKVKLF